MSVSYWQNDCAMWI